VKKNNPRWLRKQADYMAWWAGQLDGSTSGASASETTSSPR
jgi:hypothetical protein